MNDLIRTHLNCDIPATLAQYRGKKLVMKVNPAAGYIMYSVYRENRQVAETLSLDKAICDYNGLEVVQ